MDKNRVVEILVDYIGNDLDSADQGYVREVLTDVCGCSKAELKELGVYDWLGFDEGDDVMKIVWKYGIDDVVLFAEDNVIRVELCDVGEGYEGDYDPDDPEDCALLRFYVYVNDPETGWREVEDSSYCTTLKVDDARDYLEKKITILFNEFRNVSTHILSGGSVKKLAETLSWI